MNVAGTYFHLKKILTNKKWAGINCMQIANRDALTEERAPSLGRFHSHCNERAQ